MNDSDVLYWILRHETWHIAMGITILIMHRIIRKLNRYIDRMLDSDPEYRQFIKDMGLK